MKKINVSEATLDQLDWMVAFALGHGPVRDMTSHGLKWRGWWESTPKPPHSPEYRRLQDYTTDWSQLGPIIDREFISLTGWRTSTHDVRVAHLELVSTSVMGKGPTPLIAAARCFVVSKLGETVEVPEELS